MPNEIFIDHATHSKMFAYAAIAKKTLDSEVGGYLVIKELDEGGLLVEDIILPEQTVGGGSFKAKPGLKVDPEVIPKIHGWWHSHHNMGTFHSGTDNDTLGDKWNGETKGSPHYAVSIVVALPFEIKAYLQYFKPIMLEKVEIPVNVVHPISKEIYEKCEAEVKQLVSKESFFLGGCNKYFTDGFDRSELPDKKEAVEKIGGYTDKEMEDEIEAEACDTIIDPTTGMSVSELKEQGMYSPEKFDKDLNQQVESMKRILKGNRLLFQGERLKLGECPHISLNEQKRPICFLKGKNYDCTKCQRNYKKYKDKTPEQPVKKDEPIVTITEVMPPTSQPSS